MVTRRPDLPVPADLDLVSMMCRNNSRTAQVKARRPADSIRHPRKLGPHLPSRKRLGRGVKWKLRMWDSVCITSNLARTGCRRHQNKTKKTKRIYATDLLEELGIKLAIIIQDPRPLRLWYSGGTTGETTVDLQQIAPGLASRPEEEGKHASPRPETKADDTGGDW